MADMNTDNEESRKRKRKTGWDAEQPSEMPAAKAAAFDSSITSSLPMAPSLIPSPSLPPPNPQLIAQQILAKTGLAAAAISTPMSLAQQTAKLGCRIYVG
jgi:hypothetical protein